METTKNYILLKVGMLLTFILLISVNMFAAEPVNTTAAANVITEKDKLNELISYVSMGVGTVAVIWIAYFLSNRSSGSSSKRRVTH
jgi:hypothetical protein